MSVYKYITASVTEPILYLRLLYPDCRVSTGTIESNLQPQRQEPIFLLQTDKHSLISQAESEWIFYVPQHTCAGHDSGGLLLSRISHAPFATRWYGTNHLLLRLGKEGSVLPTHLLNRHRILVTRCCRV